MMDPIPARRRYDLDWLRVAAFAGVFFYHCARFFNSSYWHIKNPETSELVDIFTGIFELWGMPLIFAISGASVFFALRPGCAVRFLGDRALRLLVPLALGILVLAPPQIYLERLTHGDFEGSFIEFLPHYFSDWRVVGGDFSWSGVHLWYLEYLFLFTLILAPLFIWMKTHSGQRALHKLSRVSACPGIVFLWALPISVLAIILDPFGLVGPGKSETFLRLTLYPVFLVYGFAVFADSDIQQALIRQRRVALVLALLLSGAPPLASIGFAEWGWTISPLTFVLLMVAAGALIWSYLMACFGYAMCYWNTNRPLLAYANEAVLPFYVLHQPIILFIGYFVVRLTLPIGVKYLIIAPLSFGITLGVYEFFVRRVNLLRRAFGLKARKVDGRL